MVQSPHVVAQSIGKLIRDHWVSDICAANVTVTVSDAIVFRANGKGGAIVDPIKFEYMSPNQRIARYAATNQQIRLCSGEAIYKLESEPKKRLRRPTHHTPNLRNSTS